ncbi:hypothetical protein D3C87_1286240 [compost metagenome]
MGRVAVELHPDQPPGDPRQPRGLMRTVQSDQFRDGRAHVLHRVVPLCLLQAFDRPVGGGQCRCQGGIEVGRLLATREAQALVLGDVVLVFAVIALQPRLAVHGLLGADKAQPAGAQRYAVVRMPPAQHRARDFAGNGANGGPVPGPAGRRIPDPDFLRCGFDVFDPDAADGVRQVVIARGRHGGRQSLQAKLLEPGQEALQVLAAEDVEYELGGFAAAAPGHHGHHQPGEIGVIPLGHGGPAGGFAAGGGRGRGANGHACCSWLDANAGGSAG